MSLRPTGIPPSQDMPPPGGFRKIDLAHKFPVRGPTGWQIWLGTSLVMAYGFIQVGRTNKQRAVQKMEERKIRYAIVPLLQAEADREYMTRERANLKMAKELMKDDPSWKGDQSPYFSKKFMPRAVDKLDTGLK